eukprot:CAMPEP_0117535462 /NCGR_PEP_ID=MMETSP0784-20121206/40947_1 /TAXON_ID=39447 /ORGANISM="" /LENGTH=131 /DNA_ID=CAMNT_0005331989 /DNA_START=123 /DNA_END=518 /DNA_ORIENTATION=+
MALSMLPFPHVLVALVQFGYPLLCSLETMKKSKIGDLEYAQWTVYWVVCAIWMLAESQALWFAIDYVPLFLELKLTIFLWLVHPSYKGAAYVWYAKLETLHKKWDAEVYPRIMSGLSVAGKPKADADSNEK